jgi:DMSO/TMAO reductase YedYZ molybdopterin-dependent catalytic subunit
MTGDRPWARVGRRFFMKAAALAVFLVSLPSSLWSFFLAQFPTRTVERDNFRFDPSTGTIRWKDKGITEPYRLTVDGLVEKPASFSFDQLKAFQQITQTSDFHCVEGWSVKDIEWGGFRFDEILKRVRMKRDAKYVVFHSLGQTESRPNGLDHYVESVPLAELTDPKKKCLLALSMNGKPLIHERGAPLRTVIPLSLGYKGSKFVTRIEFSKDEQPGWWTLANPIYPTVAPVPERRLRRK